MNTKLTLTIDDTVIAKAKRYAKEQGSSLSFVIENYLKAITTKVEDDDELAPIVKSLKGSFKAPKDFDYKKELVDALSKKYL